MNRYLSYLATFLLSVLLFAGCDTSVPQQESWTSPHEELGVLHNEALDHVLAKIIEAPIEESPLASEEAMREFVIEEAERFAIEQGVAPLSAPLSKDDRRAFNQMLTARAAAPAQASLGLQREGLELVEEARRYLSDLEQSIQEGADDPARFNADVRALEQEAASLSSLSGDDAAVVLQAAAVARHSMAYWSEKGDSLAALLGRRMYLAQHEGEHEGEEESFDEDTSPIAPNATGDDRCERIRDLYPMPTGPVHDYYSMEQMIAADVGGSIWSAIMRANPLVGASGGSLYDALYQVYGHADALFRHQQKIDDWCQNMRFYGYGYCWGDTYYRVCAFH